MYQKTVLDNGIRIVSDCTPYARSVSICVFVGTGSRYEEDAEAGISHFLEHILFKGSARRPTSAEISSAIDQVGGMMNGGTDRELTSYWCKVAKPHFPQAIDVIMDMVRNPLLDAEEATKEKSVIVEELSMTNDQPGYRMEMLTDEMLWPNHPLGRDVGGSKESVQMISHNMLVDWFQRHYVSSNVVISIAGDVTHEQVLDAVVPLVKSWPQGTQSGWHPVTNGDRNVPQVKMEYKKTAQAHVGLSLPGIGNRHPHRYALDMMSTVLGEGMSSRLFLEVREKKGLAYDIHSSVDHLRDTGSIAIFFGVDPKKSRYAVETVLEELHRIKTRVPEEELNRAKELAKGRLLLRMEDTRAVAAWTGAQELLYNEILTVDDVVKKVDAITPEDIERVANEFLVFNKLNLAVVGPYRSDRQFQAVLGI